MPALPSDDETDFYPLTREEVRELLTRAASASTWQEQNSIQVRLVQGIRGLTCPYPTKGDVARRIGDVNSLYVETIKSDPASLLGLVGEFYRLLEPEG